MGIFNPRKPNKYDQPPHYAVPEGNDPSKNGTYISDKDRQLVVKIHDTGRPEDLAIALGTLEIAKDIAKNTLSQWHMRDKQASGIIIPKVETPNGLH